MKRLLLFPILALAFLATEAVAQDGQRHGARRTANLHLTVGMSMLDVDGINSALRSQEYGGISDRFFTLGATGHLVINQAVVGLDAEALLAEQASSTNETFRAAVTGRRAMLLFGYLVYEGDNLDVYPLIRTGYGTTTLEITDPAGGTFDEVLADPRRGAVLRQGGPLIGLSLGADWVFEATRGQRRGPALGVRVGYDYAPVEADWSMDGARLLSGPELSLTGPHVRILIGWGGRGALVGVR